MTALRKPIMTVDAYLAWVADQPGRWELHDGEPVAMAPQSVGHARTKLSLVNALSGAIRRAGANCHALPDGLTVRIDDRTAFEPDALVYCGGSAPAHAIEIEHPLIVVEVVSPSSAWRDHSQKLAGYFRVPSIQHYLVVDPVGRALVHHRRGEGGLIETRVISEGTPQLDPPGLMIPISDMFEAN